MSFWQITAKDLYLLVRDRRTFAMLILLPLAFITIIGLTTGQLMGWQSSNQKLKIAAVDLTDYDAIGSKEFLTPPSDLAANAEDDPAPTEPLPEDERAAQRNIAGHIVVDIFNSVQQAPGVEVRTIEDWRKTLGLPPSEKSPEETAKAMIAADEVNAALIFKPDFYQRFYHLKPADLIARDDTNSSPQEKLSKVGIAIETKDPNTSTSAAIMGIVANQARDVMEPVLFYREGTWSVQERATPEFRRTFGPVQRMGDTPPGKLQAPKRDSGSVFGNDAYQDLVPSYTVMFVFFLVNLMARSFLAERDLGTLRRLRIAPISGWSIMAGKTVPFLIVSLVQTMVLFLAGKLLFGMSWGPKPWLLLPVIFATSSAATGLGLLIATLVRSEAQVSAYATTAVIILAGISGCFMPRKWLPDLMQQVSLATPHAWALIAYDQILASPSPNLATVWQCVGMLFAFAAGFFLLGGVRFRSVG